MLNYQILSAECCVVAQLWSIVMDKPCNQCPSNNEISLLHPLCYELARVYTCWPLGIMGVLYACKGYDWVDFILFAAQAANMKMNC